MNNVVIKPYDVVSDTDLPEISVEYLPTDGDPLEISGELYFVCEQSHGKKSESQVIGVIPLVVRNPSKVQNIKKYIECLSIAHRKVQYRNERGICNLLDCDEMIISE
jgi:hypothetical protein